MHCKSGKMKQEYTNIAKILLRAGHAEINISRFGGRFICCVMNFRIQTCLENLGNDKYKRIKSIKLIKNL